MRYLYFQNYLKQQRYHVMVFIFSLSLNASFVLPKIALMHIVHSYAQSIDAHTPATQAGNKFALTLSCAQRVNLVSATW